jgi:hypothetical protein
VDATVARGVVAAGGAALAGGVDAGFTVARVAVWCRRCVDARACARAFGCVRGLALRCAGCFTKALANPLSARRMIACGVAGGAALSTPSTATPLPASAAADAAAAAIFPAVTVSTIACARRNELAARSCMCIVTVS